MNGSICGIGDNRHKLFKVNSAILYLEKHVAFHYGIF